MSSGIVLAGTALILFSPGLLAAAELSTYRGIHLGSTVSVVARHMGIAASDVKAIHTRPALVQELVWEANHTGAVSVKPDPVGELRFTFCNNSLFRIVATYDRSLTSGLSVEDVIESVSAVYGQPVTPVAEEIDFPTLFTERVKVLARWEDEANAISLARSSYRPAFGLIFIGKDAEHAAQTAIEEARRLDAAEAPQREADQQDRVNRAAEAQERQSRSKNKPNFRP